MIQRWVQVMKVDIEAAGKNNILFAMLRENAPAVQKWLFCLMLAVYRILFLYIREFVRKMVKQIPRQSI